jgi:hypothetical protein
METELFVATFQPNASGDAGLFTALDGIATPSNDLVLIAQHHKILSYATPIIKHYCLNFFVASETS